MSKSCNFYARCLVNVTIQNYAKGWSFFNLPKLDCRELEYSENFEVLILHQFRKSMSA